MKYRIKLDKIVLLFFFILSIFIFAALFFQYNYSKNVLIQNFVNKHYLDTIKIRESFKSLLDKAQYYFKTSEDENLKFLNTLPLFYSKGNFDVNGIAKILNENSVFGKYEVFKIDRNYKIVDGSYKPDIGYDLGKFKAYKQILNDVFTGKKDIDISSPHLDVSSMNLKRYYLIVSPDKKYLLQLAFVVDMFKDAKKLYEKILKNTPDLKKLKIYYVDNYLITPINFKNRYQQKLPLNIMWQRTNDIFQKILKYSNVKIDLPKNDIKKQNIMLSKLVEDIFKTKHCIIKNLDLDRHQLVFFTMIKGVFEKSNSRLIIETIYDTSKLEANIESIRKRFLLIFLAVVLGIFVIYKFVIDKVSYEIKEIVSHMKENKRVEKVSSFIEEIYELKNRYNDYHEKINQEIAKNRRLLEENKRFIVDTVHQIKTPMSVITLNLDYVKNILSTKEGFNDDEINESIEEVDAAIQMLLNSYNDLSYIASNETVDYKPQMLNLSQIVEERINFFSLIAKANNKEIRYDIDKDVYFNINRIEFERLVDNNISNAIKYSNKKDIYVSLKKEDDRIILKIESYGERIKNPIEVFERNYREHSHKRGLGIGLNIVKNICEKYQISYKTYYKDGKNIFEYIFSI
ncbi:sensor histidine kinase [Caminibacter pacificus]